MHMALYKWSTSTYICIGDTITFMTINWFILFKKNLKPQIMHKIYKKKINKQE